MRDDASCVRARARVRVRGQGGTRMDGVRWGRGRDASETRARRDARARATTDVERLTDACVCVRVCASYDVVVYQLQAIEKDFENHTRERGGTNARATADVAPSGARVYHAVAQRVEEV